MLFDTDVLIWYLRGNRKAARLIEKAEARMISVVAYMELLQGARNKMEIKVMRGFLKDWGFTTFPLTENIGHRATVYMEEYGLQVQMSLADALLASTAVENHLILCTGKKKHYQQITELELKVFRP